VEQNCKEEADGNVKIVQVSRFLAKPFGVAVKEISLLERQGAWPFAAQHSTVERTQVRERPHS
jgi:hypothetical protein